MVSFRGASHHRHQASDLWLRHWQHSVTWVEPCLLGTDHLRTDFFCIVALMITAVWQLKLLALIQFAINGWCIHNY